VLYVLTPSASSDPVRAERSRSLVFFYQTCASTLQTPPTAGQAAATDSIMRTQNGTFFASVHNAPATSKATPASKTVPSTVLPPATSTAVFVMYSNAVPLKSLDSLTASLHDKLDKFVYA
jgi:hypothetical protein